LRPALCGQVPKWSIDRASDKEAGEDDSGSEANGSEAEQVENADEDEEADEAESKAPNAHPHLPRNDRRDAGCEGGHG
jgi:hypothetical protein